MRNNKDINFLEMSDQKSKVKTGPILYGILGILVVFLIGDYTLKTKKELKEINNTVVKKEQEKKSVSADKDKVSNDIVNAKEMIKDYLGDSEEDHVDVVDTFESDFHHWAKNISINYAPLDYKMLNTLTENTPEGVFITTYDVENEKFNLEGYSRDNTVVAKLSYNLRNEDYIENVKIISMELVPNNDVSNLSFDMFKFNITGAIKGGTNSEN